MAAVLQFFARLAPFIFILLIIAFLIGLRQMSSARAEMRAAAYGLERELAHRHISQAISALVIVGFLAAAEFILVAFLVPNFPALTRLSAPTLNPLLTPTGTFPPELIQTLGAGTPGLTPTAQSAGCIPGQIDITSPKPGDVISGSIKLKGSASIPNFGFYKYEFAPVGSDNWSTVLASRQAKVDAGLGDWDVSAIPTGDYQLRLVVTDNAGNSLPACVIPLRIKAP